MKLGRSKGGFNRLLKTNKVQVFSGYEILYLGTASRSPKTPDVVKASPHYTPAVFLRPRQAANLDLAEPLPISLGAAGGGTGEEGPVSNLESFSVAPTTSSELPGITPYSCMGSRLPMIICMFWECSSSCEAYSVCFI